MNQWRNEKTSQNDKHNLGLDLGRSNGRTRRQQGGCTKFNPQYGSPGEGLRNIMNSWIFYVTALQNVNRIYKGLYLKNVLSLWFMCSYYSQGAKRENNIW